MKRKEKEWQTCQNRISCTAAPVGMPSGHNGTTIYTEKCSFALILLTIFKANSMGIKLSAPAFRKHRKL